MPDDVRLRVGRCEVRRSLGTYSFAKASQLAARYAARVMEAFAMIQGGRLEAERAQALIQACFHDLALENNRWGGFLPTTDRPEMEFLEQRELARERIGELQEMMLTAQYTGSVKAKAIEVLDTAKLSLHDLSPAGQVDVLSGIARALVEQQNHFIHRLTDRLLPYQPQDPLFLTAASPLQTSSINTEHEIVGPTLGEAIGRYLAAGEKQWVRKTYLARTWQLRFLREHLGAGTPIAAITPHDIRGFRDAVLKLRKNHGRTPSQGFAAKQTDNAGKRIAAKTATLIFEPCKAFFRWSKSVEGMIPTNPAEDVRIVPEKQTKGKKGRRPFRADELEKLFLAPLYTGCRSIHRRYEPGDRVIKDGKFWLPVLGLYSGCRLGELVQLHVSDVRLDGIPRLSINEENKSGKDQKHVKSEAGIREVPLHPDLMELGFADFVRSRQKSKKAGGRLLWEFPYGSDAQASTVASKWFARFKSTVGLTDPSTVFHSLRHNAEDAFRNAGQHQYVIDRIVGHSDNSVSAGYGDGIDLETAYAAVSSMKLKVRLPELWGTPPGEACAAAAVMVVSDGG